MRETPLWEKVYLGPGSKDYINAGKIIGHLGCSAAQFEEAAKGLPGYDKYRYENAVRALTSWQKREQGHFYELTPDARKVLRVILGPAPDDPEYAAWWRARLVSVAKMREAGQPVEWADAPPVPLEPQAKEEPKAEEPKPKAKKPKKS